MIREQLRQEATTAAVILVPIGVVLALSTTSDGVAFLRKVTPYSVAIFLAALVLICEIVATIAIYKLAIINGRFLFNSVSDRLLRSGLAVCGVLVLIIGCAGVVMDVSSLASGSDHNLHTALLSAAGSLAFILLAALPLGIAVWLSWVFQPLQVR